MHTLKPKPTVLIELGPSRKTGLKRKGVAQQLEDEKLTIVSSWEYGEPTKRW